jgi:hypothetical protein
MMQFINKCNPVIIILGSATFIYIHFGLSSKPFISSFKTVSSVLHDKFFHVGKYAGMHVSLIFVFVREDDEVKYSGLDMYEMKLKSFFILM